MVIYNRYEPLAARNGRMRMLISNDTESWRQVWQNDGTAFNASADDPPLEVTFDDLTARFVRLQLPTQDYFHLDEVQIYAPKENHSTNSPENLALGRSCTQSSVSRWSVKHSQVGSPRFEITPEVIRMRLRFGLYRLLISPTSVLLLADLEFGRTTLSEKGTSMPRSTTSSTSNGWHWR